MTTKDPQHSEPVEPEADAAPPALTRETLADLDADEYSARAVRGGGREEEGDQGFRSAGCAI